MATESLGLGDLNDLFGDASVAKTSQETKTSEEVTETRGLSLSDLAGLLDSPRPERLAEPQRGTERLMPTSWLVVSEDQWGWSELRDYIVTEGERRFGPVPRNPAKEAGIVKGFMERWGDLAVPIAKRAFTAYEGVWQGAPVRIERFAKGCDEWFAQQVAAEVSRDA